MILCTCLNIFYQQLKNFQKCKPYFYSIYHTIFLTKCKNIVIMVIVSIIRYRYAISIEIITELNLIKNLVTCKHLNGNYFVFRCV